MGHISVLLLFANVGSRPCSLRGYPGVALADLHGRVLLNAARSLTGYLGGAEGMSAPPLVTVNPGQSVSALLEWGDVPTSTSLAGCQSTANVETLVTPPNLTRTTTLGSPDSTSGNWPVVCGALDVHPVLAGVYNRPPGT